MARKLKVFQAQIGFFDTVVAAPSRAAALRAWGTHQDLFAGGAARETTDESDAKAALAHPETPLRRAVGTADPFQLEPASLPKAPAEPKKRDGRKRAAPRKRAVDRSALDTAELVLRTLDAERRAEEAELRRRQETLDAEKGAAQDAYVERRKATAAAVEEARAAYRQAGGRD